MRKIALLQPDFNLTESTIWIGKPKTTIILVQWIPASKFLIPGSTKSNLYISKNALQVAGKVLDNFIYRKQQCFLGTIARLLTP
jgi:hypothetical protein